MENLINVFLELPWKNIVLGLFLIFCSMFAITLLVILFVGWARFLWGLICDSVAPISYGVPVAKNPPRPPRKNRTQTARKVDADFEERFSDPNCPYAKMAREAAKIDQDAAERAHLRKRIMEAFKDEPMVVFDVVTHSGKLENYLLEKHPEEKGD